MCGVTLSGSATACCDLTTTDTRKEGRMCCSLRTGSAHSMGACSMQRLTLSGREPCTDRHASCYVAQGGGAAWRTCASAANPVRSQSGSWRRDNVFVRAANTCPKCTPGTLTSQRLARIAVAQMLCRVHCRGAATVAGPLTALLALPAMRRAAKRSSTTLAQTTVCRSAPLRRHRCDAHVAPDPKQAAT